MDAAGAMRVWKCANIVFVSLSIKIETSGSISAYSTIISGLPIAIDKTAFCAVGSVSGTKAYRFRVNQDRIETEDGISGAQYINGFVAYFTNS